MQRVTIDLHDEPRLPREKVDDEVTEDDLAPKRDAQTPSADGAEEERFRRSRMEAHESSALLEEGDTRR